MIISDIIENVVLGNTTVDRYWTPNFNGASSYILIPDWSPTTYGTVSMNVALTSTSNRYQLFMSYNPTSHTWIGSDRGNWQWHANITNVKVNGVLAVKGTPVPFDELFHLSFNVSSAGIIKLIGEGAVSSDNVKGYIRDVYMFDAGNPANTRRYSSRVAAEQPTSLTVIDNINRLDGTMNGFTSGSEWVEVLG